MIFHRNFLKQGELGGKVAATTINNAIFEWARNNIAEVPEETRVVVHVYGNLKGIAEACAKNGMVDHPSRVEEFVQGFTSAHLLCDFIDVGFGKDAVEGKIHGESSNKVLNDIKSTNIPSENLKLYLYNYYCRHILFGGSHKDDYANMLQPYMNDTQAKGRITLLEGVPFGPELAALPLRQKKIPGIFRDVQTTLPGPLHIRTDSRMRPGSSTSLNAASSVFTPRTQTPSLSSPFGSVTSFDHNAMTGRPYHRAEASMNGSSAEIDDGSWSQVASRNAHRPVKDLVASPPRLPAPTIQRNKKGYRIDTVIQCDRNEVQRLKKLKACNQHYIGNGCCHYNAGKADKCPHNHHFQFSPSDLKALRVVARETPCKKGHDCEDLKCIYGHQCPFPVASEGSMRGSGLCMIGEACRFPVTMHGMDLQSIRITKVTGIC